MPWILLQGHREGTGLIPHQDHTKVNWIRQQGHGERTGGTVHQDQVEVI